MALVQPHQVHGIEEALLDPALAQRLDSGDRDPALLPLAIPDDADHVLWDPGVADQHVAPLVQQLDLVNQDVSEAWASPPDHRTADRRLARAGRCLVYTLLMLDDRLDGGGLVSAIGELLHTERRTLGPLAPVKPPDAVTVLTQQQLVLLGVAPRHDDRVAVQFAQQDELLDLIDAPCLALLGVDPLRVDEGQFIEDAVGQVMADQVAVYAEVSVDYGGDLHDRASLPA